MSTPTPDVPEDFSVNGKYYVHFEKELGNGAFGVTFLAVLTYPSRVQKRVAIKYTFPNKASSKGIIPEKESFNNILAIGSGGCVPNIICYHEYLILSATSYPEIYQKLINYFSAFEVPEAEPIAMIITDFYDGDDLSKVLDDPTGITRDQLQNFVSQMLTALTILHKNGVAHRDIKPENIMCNADRTQFYLIDFGLACSSDICDLAGTIDYMPNSSIIAGARQIKGPTPMSNGAPKRAVVSKSLAMIADVFALGVTIYNLLVPLDADGYRSFPWSDRNDANLYRTTDYVPVVTPSVRFNQFLTSLIFDYDLGSEYHRERWFDRYYGKI